MFIFDKYNIFFSHCLYFYKKIKKLLTTTVLYDIVQTVQRKWEVRNVFKLDHGSSKPVYEQIKDNYKRLIIEGVLKENEKIMSVRELAVAMAINPNTIQKAYKELENEGYIYSMRAKGSFVSPLVEIKEDKTISRLKKTIEENISELCYLGVAKHEIEKIICEIYERRNNCD